MTILLTGSHGLIGSHLLSFLRTRGYRVIPLVRSQKQASDPGVRVWDPENGIISENCFADVDAVVHLAGEPIFGIWTAEKRKRIRSSRVEGTRFLVEKLKESEHSPSVFVSASAVGYYGDRGDERLDESMPAGDGFLSDVCRQWEAASKPLLETDTRRVIIRLGLVLSPAGGLLKTILPFFRVGLGGPLGNGQQYMSWIALFDLVRVIEFLLHTGSINGAVNGVAPHPVTNKEFTRALARAVHRPALIPVPSAAIRLVFGKMGDEMILSSLRVSCDKLTSAGFQFNEQDCSLVLRTMLAD